MLNVIRCCSYGISTLKDIMTLIKPIRNANLLIPYEKLLIAVFHAFSYVRWKHNTQENGWNTAKDYTDYTDCLQSVEK